MTSVDAQFVNQQDQWTVAVKKKILTGIRAYKELLVNNDLHPKAGVGLLSKMLLHAKEATQYAEAIANQGDRTKGMEPAAVDELCHMVYLAKLKALISNDLSFMSASVFTLLAHTNIVSNSKKLLKRDEQFLGMFTAVPHRDDIRRIVKYLLRVTEQLARKK